MRNVQMRIRLQLMWGDLLLGEKIYWRFEFLFEFLKFNDEVCIVHIEVSYI